LLSLAEASITSKSCPYILGKREIRIKKKKKKKEGKKEKKGL